MRFSKSAGLLAFWALMFVQAQGQTATDISALKGLAPVSVLLNSETGEAVLGANYTVTGGIQTGTLAQPTLLPFALQQQQALREALLQKVSKPQDVGAEYRQRTPQLV